MQMVALFHIALVPSADEADLRARVERAAAGHAVFGSTRITVGISHALLIRQGVPGRQFAWEVRVDLMTDRGYDFAASLDRVQETVAGLGVVTGLEVYSVVGGS